MTRTPHRVLLASVLSLGTLVGASACSLGAQVRVQTPAPSRSAKPAPTATAPPSSRPLTEAQAHAALVTEGDLGAPWAPTQGAATWRDGVLKATAPGTRLPTASRRAVHRRPVRGRERATSRDRARRLHGPGAVPLPGAGPVSRGRGPDAGVDEDLAGDVRPVHGGHRLRLRAERPGQRGRTARGRGRPAGAAAHLRRADGRWRTDHAHPGRRRGPHR